MIKSPYDQYFEFNGYVNQKTYKLRDLNYVIFDDGGEIVTKGYKLNHARNLIQPADTVKHELSYND